MLVDNDRKNRTNLYLDIKKKKKSYSLNILLSILSSNHNHLRFKRKIGTDSRDRTSSEELDLA